LSTLKKYPLPYPLQNEKTIPSQNLLHIHTRKQKISPESSSRIRQKSITVKYGMSNNQNLPCGSYGLLEEEQEIKFAGYAVPSAMLSISVQLRSQYIMPIASVQNQQCFFFPQASETQRGRARARFGASVEASGRLRGWKNAIFAGDNPQENGIFPPLRLPDISRNLAQKRALARPRGPSCLHKWMKIYYISHPCLTYLLNWQIITKTTQEEARK